EPDTGWECDMKRSPRGPAPSPASIATARGRLLTPHLALADWPASGRAIINAAGAQLHPVSATDGAGGAIVVWEDLRDPRINIFAGHVLATGELDPAWPAGGRALLTDAAAL